MICEGPSSFRCTDCTFQTAYKSSLVNHIEAKHFNYSYSCNLCGRVQSSKASLNMHFMRVHRDQSMKNPWKRLNLFIAFAVLDNLISSKMGRDPATGSWYCVDCHYESANKGDVRNHIEAKHIDTVGTSCDICGIVTKTRKAMKMHKMRQHKPTPPFCEILSVKSGLWNKSQMWWPFIPSSVGRCHWWAYGKTDWWQLALFALWNHFQQEIQHSSSRWVHPLEDRGLEMWSVQ